mgnify:CR=1 FL=1
MIGIGNYSTMWVNSIPVEQLACCHGHLFYLLLDKTPRCLWFVSILTALYTLSVGMRIVCLVYAPLQRKIDGYTPHTKTINVCQPSFKSSNKINGFLKFTCNKSKQSNIKNLFKIGCDGSKSMRRGSTGLLLTLNLVRSYPLMTFDCWTLA